MAAAKRNDVPLIIAPYENDDEKGFKGYLYDIPAIVYYGDTKDEVLKEIEEVKKEWFTFALDEGIRIPEPFSSFPNEFDASGKFTLRLPKSLHNDLVLGAQNEGVSINTPDLKKEKK